MTLPDAFVPLAFDPARGVPQTVPAEVGGRSLRVTLAVAASDLPALIATSPTSTIVDVSVAGSARASSVPADVRDRFRSPAPPTLDAAVVRPLLMVREHGVLLGVHPALVGVVLRFGSAGRGGLVAEIRVEAIELVAGAFAGPGALGGTIQVGIRPPVPATPTGRRRPLSPEELYASLT